jgi:hypothetical protein
VASASICGSGIKDLVCTVSIVEDSLLDDTELSRPELLADLDRFRTDDVLTRYLDAAVVMDVVW